MSEPVARGPEMHSCPRVTAVLPHGGDPVTVVQRDEWFVGSATAPGLVMEPPCSGPPDTKAKGSAPVLSGGGNAHIACFGNHVTEGITHMATYHDVQPGDCISSIAMTYGFFPETIWEHAENRALREKRADPNILWHKEDTVFIPDKRLKTDEKSSGHRHRFRRKGVPEILRIRFLDEDDDPRANIPYRMEIDGRLRHGAINEDGFLIEPIEPNTRLGRLFLGEPDQEEEYQFRLGHLPPITTIEGVQARLTHLGYYHGEKTGVVDDDTRSALEDFQGNYDLKVTGEADSATCAILEGLHLS